MSHGSKKILPAVQAVLQHSNNGNNNEPSIPLPPNANFDENDNGTYHANLPTQHFSNVHPHPTHLNYIQQLQQQYFHQHQQLQLQHPSYVYPNITCGGGNLLLSSSFTSIDSQSPPQHDTNQSTQAIVSQIQPPNNLNLNDDLPSTGAPKLIHNNLNLNESFASSLPPKQSSTNNSTNIINTNNNNNDVAKSPPLQSTINNTLPSTQTVVPNQFTNLHGVGQDFLPQTFNNNNNNDDDNTDNQAISKTTSSSSSSFGFDIDNPNFYTSDDMKHIKNIEVYCKEVIPVGRDTTYDSAMKLKDHINEVVGEKYGFKVGFQGSAIKCLNADAPTAEKKRNAKRQANLPDYAKRQRKKRRCGCDFGVNYSSSNNRDKEDKSVFVTKANFLHSNGCRPSSQQLLQQHVSSGTFTRKGVSQRSISTLLDMMRYEDHVESKTVRNILKEVLPEAAPVDAALIANVRTRAKKMLDAMEKDKHGKLKNAPMISVEDADNLIQQSLDDAANGTLCGVELTNPEFVGIATQELKIMLGDALEKGKELDQIICFLTEAKACDPAFDFRVAKNNRTGKIVGILWQDGVMRGHCQGGLLDVVMLDMMKRQQNTADWPYCGPVLITGENKIACACEAIVLSEGTNYYSWIMNSVYEMSGVDRSETKIIFGDGIHSDNLLNRISSFVY